jgi:hypothetical protein
MKVVGRSDRQFRTPILGPSVCEQTWPISIRGSSL